MEPSSSLAQGVQRPANGSPLAALSVREVRAFRGAAATEVRAHLRPTVLGVSRADEEAAAMYRGLQEALRPFGGSIENVVHETVFFRNVERDLDHFLEGSWQALVELNVPGRPDPASTFVEQAPADSWVRFELVATAVIPHGGLSAASWNGVQSRACACGGCTEQRLRVLLLGNEKHVWAGNVYGSSGSPFDEALSLFRSARTLLGSEGLDFRSVVRTWIYLRDIDRHYADFNRARREFFAREGIEAFPASTGIGGGLVPEGHNFSMSFHAISPGPLVRAEPLSTATLNEASEYGSDFSRGLRLADSNGTALVLSGTASIDASGRTVHRGDLDAQVERMLLNVEKLLQGGGAGFRNVASAVTYIRRAADAPRLRAILGRRGLAGFPHTIVQAPLCRPDLLCEMEVVAFPPEQRSAEGAGRE